jgi:hypothetical protein
MGNCATSNAREDNDHSKNHVPLKVETEKKLTEP